jgi:tRNA pseudouridine13 synthase
MTLPAEILSRIINPPTAGVSVLSSVRIRTTVADFVVEEIAAYEPSGAGEHAYLWIEKRGLSSPELVSRVMRTLGVSSKDVGIAGQKDRHAVTRQWCSIPRRYAERADELNSADLSVLSVTLHRNKLKTGHLKGNRFQLVLRNEQGKFTSEDLSKVQQRMQQLEHTGFPNYFGPQRFGHGGSTLNDGLRLLHGKLPKDHWPPNHDRTLRRLALSAVQSAVFNLVAGQRVADGTFATPIPGDVVIRKDGIKPFRYPENSEATDLIPAGPMPGPEMMAAEGTVAEMENVALQTLGLKPVDFTRYEKLTSGIRRKFAEFPSETSVTLTSDEQLQLGFSLTAGTYATTMLTEVAQHVVDRGGDTA